MTAPIRYNPCADGFPAKAWECLRRNKAFVDDFKEALLCEDAARCRYLDAFRGRRSTDEAMLWLMNDTRPAIIFLRRMQSHPFYDAIHKPLMDFFLLDREDEDNFTSLIQSMHLGDCWSELDQFTQEGIEYSLYRHGAEIAETPDESELNPHAVESYSKKKTESFLVTLSTYLSTNRIVYLPKVVWDRAHKESILAEVSDLLGKPLAKDSRWLQHKGRVLGSEAEWRAFLLVEQWRKREYGGYGSGMAASLAAWEIYDGEDFGEGAQVRLESGLAFRERRKRGRREPLHNQKSLVEKQVLKIEKAIKSVYPVFNPVLGA